MRMDPQQKERMDELAAQMSEKQKVFCDFYVETLNQTEAAILAGYSKKTARTTGSENMTKPYIKEYIDLRLAELEEAGKLTAVITQNIDGLHQAAGSKNVLELHGSIHRNYCMKCHKFYDAAYVKNASGIPRCTCGGMIKPDVVLYEEGLDSDVISRSIKAISEADTLIIGGTSLVVYPAAGFIDYFRGKHLVVINKSATAREVGAKLTIAAPIGEILGRVH